MMVSPLEVSWMATAVDRSMAPGTEFGPEARRYAIMMPPVIFVLEPEYWTIMVTLGLISPAAVPFKFANRWFIPFLKAAAAVLVKLVNRRSIPILKVAASIHTAIAAPFALGP